MVGMVLRREASAIVAASPDLDTGDVYHALRSLELTPSERLRRGLIRVRELPLERVIAGKAAANRLKDAAQMPMLHATLDTRNAGLKDHE